MTKSRFITFCGISTAIICVLSQISFPIGAINLTLQTFAVALCTYLFGWKISAASVLVYILLGIAGLPVFSGFNGGFGIIIGPSGGFIIGFLPMSVLLGIFKRKYSVLIFGVLGLCACYLSGCTQFALVTSRTFSEAFMLVCTPFIIKDIISLIFAYIFSVKINKYVNKFE